MISMCLISKWSLTLSDVSISMGAGLVIWVFTWSRSADSLKWATTMQKRKYEDVYEAVFVFLFSLILSEILLAEFGNLDSKLSAALLISFNLLFVFFLRSKKRDPRTIQAAQNKNFDLPIKKVEIFDKNIKTETEEKSKYYHLLPVLNRSDLTVEKIELGKYTMSEYSLLERELLKPYVPNNVYDNLIEYYNRKGAEYGLRTEAWEGEWKNRGIAEMRIMTLFLRLIDKKIPIRISQLLQHVGEVKYLSNFVYFLMCLESEKIVPKAVLYALFFAKYEETIREK